MTAKLVLPACRTLAESLTKLSELAVENSKIEPNECAAHLMLATAIFLYKYKDSRDPEDLVFTEIMKDWPIVWELVKEHKGDAMKVMIDMGRIKNEPLS